MSKRLDDGCAVRLTLVRHGQSTFNERGLYQGASDVPVLTPKGCEQAVAAARLISSTPFDAFYVSPLQRARKTAHFLKHRLDRLPRETLTPLLREIELPEWEGRPFTDVIAQERGRHRSWKFSPQTFEMRDFGGAVIAPGRDIVERVRIFLDMVQRDCAGRSVLAVAHGGTIRAILSVLLDMPGDRLHAINQENCGVTTLVFGPQRATLVVGLNRAAVSDRRRLERVIDANKPAYVLANADVSTALQRDYTFANTLDARERPIDLLRGGEITGPTLVRADVDLQAQLMRTLLGISADRGHRLDLDANGFQLIRACTPTGPGALDILNGRANVVDHLPSTSPILLKEAG